jgi:hypothetical protein
MKVLAPELSALITIFLSVGPVISTLQEDQSCSRLSIEILTVCPRVLDREERMPILACFGSPPSLGGSQAFSPSVS